MNVFLCLSRQSGEPVGGATCRRYSNHRCLRGTALKWHDFGSFAALVFVDPAIGFGPEVVRWHDHVGVGVARLDNRREIAASIGCKGDALSDMELIVRAVGECGDTYVPRLLGDFSFVVSDLCTRTLVAACDAFAVKKLYYTTSPGLTTFASRAELLTTSEQYDTQYLVELLGYCTFTPGKTVYANVSAIPPASVLVIRQGRSHTNRYWSVYDYSPDSLGQLGQERLIEEFRELFSTAVRLRVTQDPTTWAHLSGGLDSSSVVCMAQWLVNNGVVPYGLAGTVTYVDSHGTGADEREYSSSVVDAYGIHNTLVEDYECWRDDRVGPPMLDQPVPGYAFYARDRQTASIVRGKGGKVLLTGVGGDNVLTGNMLFFADWLTAGKYRQAITEMLRRAAIGHVSFWELAGRNAILPFLPRFVQNALAEGWAIPPSWISPQLVQKFELLRRSVPSESYGGRRGRKYADAVAYMVGGVSDLLVEGITEEMLDVRHPYLYRPLVEFALKLAPEMCVQPHARKWILRQALQGILPESIRTRVGKGVTFGLLAWSVVAQQKQFERILNDSILADLGCIDGGKLRGALAAAQREREGGGRIYAHVQHTLAVEAWLRVRSGRWAAVDMQTRS